MKAKIVSYFAGMLFMITFGIMDNAFLVKGMDWFNPLVDMFSDPKLSAMIGNTISDVIGAVAGVIVSWIFLKLFKVTPSEHILVEILGVVTGCLIPIFIYLL